MQQPATIDLSNWMSQLSPLIENWPLKKIVMPGTHDSAMYPGMLPADYAKNQNLDFTGQLNHGARYFDFRTGYFWADANCVPGGFFDPRNGGECWSCPPNFNRTWDPVTADTACSQGWFGPFSKATFHRNIKLGWQSVKGPATACFGNTLGGSDYYMYGHGTSPSYVVGVKLADALNQINAWLNAHPGEVVILSVTAIRGLDDANNKDPYIEDVFTKTLPAGRLYPFGSATLPQNATLSALKGKIVVIGDVGWKEADVIDRTGWGNFEDSNGMLAYIQKGLDTIRPVGTTVASEHKLFELSGVLTPNGTGVVGPIPTNPQDLAKKFNPIFQGYINGAWKGRALNIVTVDYIDITGVADSIVRANWTVPQ